MTALDSFRFPPTPGNIANETGSTTPCGYIPDVYGNNAYFNNLCLGTQPYAIAGTLSGTTSTPITPGVTTIVNWNAHGETGSPSEIPASPATAPFQFLIVPITGYYICTCIGLQISPDTTGSVLIGPVAPGPVVLANLSPVIMNGINGNVEFNIVQNYNAGQLVGVFVESATSGLVYSDSGADFSLVFLGR